MFGSLRNKLTFWYALILASALIIFALVFYFLIDQIVHQLADDSLDDASDALITKLENEPDQSKESIEQALEDFRFQYTVFAIYDDKGEMIASSPRLKKESRLKFPTFNLSIEEIPVEILKANQNASGAYDTFTTKSYVNVRIFQENAKIGNKQYRIASFRPLTNQTELLANIRLLLLVGVPVALLLSIFGGYYLADKGLAPLVEMNEKASYISSHNLHERLPQGKSSIEIEQLSATFNEMLTRLEESFELQKRFMSDASHELRTPLAIMRGEAEVSLQKDSRSENDYRESLEVIEQEGTRLSKIVEDLFTLARADSDQYKLNLSTFYLDELLNETAKALRTLLKKKELKFEIKTDRDLVFEGDEALIRRLLIILLDNAIKYSDRKGFVSVKCLTEENLYSISVSNSGNPIPEEKHDKIFERFYRTDDSRSHNDEYEFGTGAGLGLAMGKWIAEAHHGSLTLDKSNQNETLFLISLPKPSK